MDEQTKITVLRAVAPVRQPNVSLPASLAPASPAFAAAHLSSCLTLVRPASMTDEQAEEWLAIGAQDLADFPEDVIEMACRHARRVCRFPSEVIPAAVAHCEETMRIRRREFRPRMAAEPVRKAVACEPLDIEFLNGSGPMCETLRRLGIASGHLVDNGDGTVSLAPNDAA